MGNVATLIAAQKWNMTGNTAGTVIAVYPPSTERLTDDYGGGEVVELSCSYDLANELIKKHSLDMAELTFKCELNTQIQRKKLSNGKAVAVQVLSAYKPVPKTPVMPNMGKPVEKPAENKPT